MQSEVMFAGFGGQGIMMIGKMLAYAALEQGQEVAWIPSYGPEMRGGTAYCTVVFSDRPVGSPIIAKPSDLVVMNRPSLEKFAPCMKAKGVCMVNSSLIPIETERADIDELRVPCNDIAIDLGNARCANIVALGAFCGRQGKIDLDLIRKQVEKQFASKPKLIPLNIKALEAGIEQGLKVVK